MEIRDAIIEAVNNNFTSVRAAAGATDSEFTLSSLRAASFDLKIDTKMESVSHVSAVDIAELRRSGVRNMPDEVDGMYWLPQSNKSFTFSLQSKYYDEEVGVIRAVEITDNITGETFIVEA